MLQVGHLTRLLQSLTPYKCLCQWEVFCTPQFSKKDSFREGCSSSLKNKDYYLFCFSLFQASSYPAWEKFLVKYEDGHFTVKLVPRQAFKDKEYCAGFILGRFLISWSSLLCLDHSTGSFIQSAVWIAYSLSKGKGNVGKNYSKNFFYAPFFSVWLCSLIGYRFFLKLRRVSKWIPCQQQ